MKRSPKKLPSEHVPKLPKFVREALDEGYRHRTRQQCGSDDFAAAASETIHVILQRFGLEMDQFEEVLAQARDARFRAALEHAGAAISWPTGEPVGPDERRPLVPAGEPPVSEQIIAERR